MKNILLWFDNFARAASEWLSSASANALAWAMVALWLLGGIHFGYGTDYQMYINTSTTIITFLMVFVVGYTQVKDSKALHLKLDALIAASRARNNLINLENLSPEEFQVIAAELHKLRDQ